MYAAVVGRASAKMIISVVVFLDFAIHFKKFATVVERNSEIILAAIPKLTRFC